MRRRLDSYTFSLSTNDDRTHGRETSRPAEQLATEFATGASSMAELNALLQTMMKRRLETMLNAEMDHHLATEAEREFPRRPASELPRRSFNQGAASRLEGLKSKPTRSTEPLEPQIVASISDESKD